jgi:predicted nucleic acid-binding protein
MAEVSEAIVEVPSGSLLPVSRDPDDDHVLAAAVVGEADCIVTGDKDLLVLDPYEGIRIVTPREFLDVLEGQS